MGHYETLVALVGGILIGGSTAVVMFRWAFYSATRRALRENDPE